MNCLIKISFASLLVLFVSSLSVATPVPTDPYEKPSPPMPYDFNYAVKDPYAGTDFGQNEKSDGNTVVGSYSVQLPDGRKQIVNYKADHYNGFTAEVAYVGQAQYAPKSNQKPFVVPPSKGY